MTQVSADRWPVGRVDPHSHTHSRECCAFFRRSPSTDAGAREDGATVQLFGIFAYEYHLLVRKVRHIEEIPNCLDNRGSSRRKWMPLSSSFVSRTQKHRLPDVVPLCICSSRNSSRYGQRVVGGKRWETHSRQVMAIFPKIVFCVNCAWLLLAGFTSKHFHFSFCFSLSAVVASLCSSFLILWRSFLSALPT